MYKANNKIICDTPYRVRTEIQTNNLQERYYTLIDKNVLTEDEYCELCRIESILNDYLH